MLPTNVRERRVLRRRLAPLRHGERREVRHVPRRPRQPVAAARDESPPGREVDRDEPLLVAFVRAAGHSFHKVACATSAPQAGRASSSSAPVASRSCT